MCVLYYSSNEAKNIAGKMINSRLFTKQTGEAGTLCHKVMVSERLYSRREYYFAIVLDRAAAVSSQGILCSMCTVTLLLGLSLINFC